jgi:hypothetical protein
MSYASTMPRPATAFLTLFLSLMMTLGAWAQDAPEIVVTEAGINIPDGRLFGGNRIVDTTMNTVFVIQNTGSAPLTGLQLTAEGPDADFISFGEQPASTVAPGGNTYFRLYFSPAWGLTRPICVWLAMTRMKIHLK